MYNSPSAVAWNQTLLKRACYLIREGDEEGIWISRHPPTGSSETIFSRDNTSSSHQDGYFSQRSSNGMMSLAFICRVIEIVIISLHQRRYQWSQYLCLAKVNVDRICTFFDDGMNQNSRIAKIKLILHLKSLFIIR
jgi:hypothetical protein